MVLLKMPKMSKNTNNNKKRKRRPPQELKVDPHSGPYLPVGPIDNKILLNCPLYHYEKISGHFDLLLHEFRFSDLFQFPNCYIINF